MRITLELDGDVLAVARRLAAQERRSVGSVVSDLVRRGIVDADRDRAPAVPAIDVPAGTPPITPEMVRQALGDG